MRRAERNERANVPLAPEPLHVVTSDETAHRMCNDVDFRQVVALHEPRDLLADERCEILDSARVERVEQSALIDRPDAVAVAPQATLEHVQDATRLTEAIDQ